jgi:hypothetical protein
VINQSTANLLGSISLMLSWVYVFALSNEVKKQNKRIKRLEDLNP